MRLLLLKISRILLLLPEISAAGVGKAWQVLPYATDYWNHPSWPRLDSSAFEVRSVSGVGHLTPLETTQRNLNLNQPQPVEPNAVPSTKHFAFSQKFEPIYANSFYDHDENHDETNEAEVGDKIFRTGLMMTILKPEYNKGSINEEIADEEKEGMSRIRRDTENETKLEQIATAKNVREVRLNSPETWSTQPLSIEYPHRSGLDQMIQQTVEDEDLPNARSYQAPRAGFVTSHHRRSYEHREARDMPVTRGYDEYDFPWYRNAIRDRDYDPVAYRRGFSYYYPDRYRMERDYYMRVPNDYSYYYDRFRDEDLDLYGRSRATPKSKRIIYYATLPEVVRKPVDLRNYPRSYDGTRSPVSRDGTFKRIPGNVDPSRYRYRHLYDGYDSYSKRSSFSDRPYPYPEDESRRKVTLDSLRNNDHFDQNNDRKLANQISVRNQGNLPWPVQIGTEVSVKDDEKIPGRKIFGENNGYERFQSAQLQKAPDATGSSELQSDN
ncbi:hypothetical protein WH47_07369 [Habropoda laboriosa]|uniref:Uncharacterized protein n=1 Tax=Habropoda laboriosa TaxID=597456 RepID=A0A0L7R602_9HYME|nr:PREDICTED: uncharacterized protein LOC108571612 [Habropoda laboriosa]KOC66300.1 hypothetical protein WH47_07369 [Habropoda laboriosa]